MKNIQMERHRLSDIQLPVVCAPLPTTAARIRWWVLLCLLSTAILIVFGACKDDSSGPKVYRLHSPDGRLAVTLTVGGVHPIDGTAGGVFYTVSRDGETIVDKSPLGIETDRASFVHDLSVLEANETTVDETYQMLTGKRHARVVAANRLTLHLANDLGAEMELVVEAHDDGVAYRYRLLGSGEVVVENEESGFSLPAGATAFLMPYDVLEVYFFGTYEQMPAEMDAGRQTYSSGWAYPALFEVTHQTEDAPPHDAPAATWLLITEADLRENYCGTRLSPEPTETLYSVVFPVAQEGNHVGAINPRATLPLETPWRVIVAGDLATIVESTLVDDLSLPSTVDDTSWIHPGRASWSWYSHEETGDATLQRQYVDFAAEMGWEYTLVDARWDQWPDPDTQIPALIATADASGVKILLWYNSGGPHNTMTEATPRDRMLDPEIRRNEMERIAAWGAAGIKVDFFESDKQDRIEQYLGILQDAADHQLLVNFHGATLPRGWQRTYPHLMTHEAVRGAEYFRVMDLAERPNADTHLFYVFARNVVGSMDYTPVVFEDALRESELPYAHSLAQAVLFESGLQHFADSADSGAATGYRAVFDRHPFVADLLAAVPVAWDDTLLLAGTPRTHAVVARRKGDNWWIAGIAGTLTAPDTPETIGVNSMLDFLDSNTYDCRLVTQDPQDPRILLLSEQPLTAADSLEVTLSAREGFVAHLTPHP